VTLLAARGISRRTKELPTDDRRVGPRARVKPATYNARGPREYRIFKRTCDHQQHGQIMKGGRRAEDGSLNRGIMGEGADA